MTELKNFEEQRWVRLDQPIVFRHRAALDLIKPGSSVLDVGCGDGLFLKLVNQQKKTTGVGVDLSENAIKKALEDNNQSIKFHVFDLDSGKLPFEDNAFDEVVALDVLEHSLEPTEFLKEMSRVSKCRLIIGVPNFSSFPARLQCLFGQVPENNKPKKGHVYWFNYVVLKKILEDNSLEIVELKYNTQGGNIPGIKQLFMLLGKILPNLYALSFVVLCRKVN